MSLYFYLMRIAAYSLMFWQGACLADNQGCPASLSAHAPAGVLILQTRLVSLLS